MGTVSAEIIGGGCYVIYNERTDAESFHKSSTCSGGTSKPLDTPEQMLVCCVPTECSVRMGGGAVDGVMRAHTTLLKHAGLTTDVSSS